jgi:hypothetical protein
MENLSEEIKAQKRGQLRMKALHKASRELGFSDFLSGLGQSGGIAHMEIVERSMEYYAEWLTDDLKPLKT